MIRHDDLKIGTLVGTDKFGNKYYENNYYFYGRNRWVHYADHVHMDYDASQIPVEWYGWMHYKVKYQIATKRIYFFLFSSLFKILLILFKQTDKLPSQDERRPNYKWMTDHSENLSGTPGNK